MMQRKNLCIASDMLVYKLYYQTILALIVHFHVRMGKNDVFQCLWLKPHVHMASNQFGVPSISRYIILQANVSHLA